MDSRCPECGCTETQQLEVAWNSGATPLRAGGHAGTRTAQDVEPPKQKALPFLLGAATLVAAVGCVTAGLILAVYMALVYQDTAGSLVGVTFVALGVTGLADGVRNALRARTRGPALEPEGVAPAVRRVGAAALLPRVR